MAKESTFGCKLLVSDASKPLDFKILLDGDEVFSESTTQSEYDFLTTIKGTDSDNHKLKFVLSGKTDNHTTLDDNGGYISSAQVEVTNITFDGNDISDILLSNETISTYTHNSNGYSDEIIEDFNTSCMGFNGEIELRFRTPINMWLLDIM